VVSLEVLIFYPDLGDNLFKKGGSPCGFQHKIVEIIKVIVEVCFVKGTSNTLFIICDCFIAVMNLAKALPDNPSHNLFIEFSQKCLMNTHTLNSEVRIVIRDGLLVAIMVRNTYIDKLIQPEEEWCKKG
jgi:hypothetical protein